MLFLTLKKHYSALKPFIILFNNMPDIIYNIDGKDIRSSDINMDTKIINALRNI
jgi:hypothetical protein